MNKDPKTHNAPPYDHWLLKFQILSKQWQLFISFLLASVLTTILLCHCIKKKSYILIIFKVPRIKSPILLFSHIDTPPRSGISYMCTSTHTLLICMHMSVWIHSFKVSALQCVDLLTELRHINDTFNFHRPFSLKASVATQSLQIDCKIANNHD